MYRNRLAAAAAALLLASAGAPAADRTLTINSYGGSYEAAVRKCVIEPFEQETGAQVKVVTAYSADLFAQMRAQKKAPQYDVAHFSSGQEITAAREGLIDPIPADKLSHVDELYDFARAGLARGAGPAYQLAASGFIYNTEKMDQPPTHWTDLTKPEFGPNLLLVDISAAYGLLNLLMINHAYGGDLDNIQPGLDAVSAMLENGASIVSTSSELQQSFAQGDTWLAPYPQDYAYTLVQAGLPVKYLPSVDGAPVAYVTANLVHGRDNQDLAIRFIDREISAEAQACFAEEMRYSPTNREVKLSPELAAELIVGEEAVSRLIRFDPVKVEENLKDYTRAWRRTVAR